MRSEYDDTQTTAQNVPKQGQNEELPLAPVKENWYKIKKAYKRLEKRKNPKKFSLPKKQFRPHFGFDSFSSFSEMFAEASKATQTVLPDEVIRHVEGVGALFLNLQECQTHQQFISAVFLYVRSFSQRSVSNSVFRYLGDLMNDKSFTQQSGIEPLPNWLQIVRNLNTDWTLLKGNKAYKHFCKLMSVLITLGLCDVSSLDFDIEGFKLFDDSLLKKHVTAFDMIDIVLGTCTFFIEGAYLCFKTGSLKPILLNDFAILQIEDEYLEVLAMWDLAQNGNLERLSKISDNEFTRRLGRCLSDIQQLAMGATGFDKKLLMDKIVKLKTIKYEHYNKKLASGLREAPFCLEFWGKSNQGKSIISDQLTTLLLASKNLPVDPTYRAAITPGAKHWDNWTSDKLVAILDDFANEKDNGSMEPPTRDLINIVNNMMYAAPKAELEGKGKCFVEPKLCIVTTNVKNLDAGKYSNCPISVQRRPKIVIKVTAKPEFCKENGGMDSSKVKEFYTDENGVYSPPPIDDVWICDLEEAVEPQRLSTVAGYRPYKWRGKEMTGVSAIELLQCAIEGFHAHEDEQKRIIAAKKSRCVKREKCSKEGCPHLKGMCPDHVEPQFGIETCLNAYKMVKKVQKKAEVDHDTFLEKVESRLTQSLYGSANKFIDKWDWLCLIPEDYISHPYMINFCEWYYKDEIEQQRLQSKSQYDFFALFILLLGFINGAYYYGAFIALVAWLIFRCAHIFFYRNYEKQRLLEALKKRNNSLPLIVKNVRDGYAQAFIATCATAGAIYTVVKILKVFKDLKSKQGSLEPKTVEDVKIRDSETNIWTSVQKRPLPATQYSKEHTFSVVENKIKKNLFYASVLVKKERRLMANVLFLRSNVLVIPNHYFEADDIEVTCYRDKPDAMGGKFTTKLSKQSSVLIPDTDFRLCFSAVGGSFGDLTKYLPTGKVVDHPFAMFWRKKDGTMVDAKGKARAKTTYNGVESFEGGEYDFLNINTFNGLCGAVMLSHGKDSVLTGFHLGGIADTPKGCFGTLTKSQFDESCEKLRSLPGVLLTGSSEKFTGEVMGTTLLREDPLHEKSPLNFMPQGSQFVYYGSVIGQSTSRSDVRKSKISNDVAEICGVPNKWGPPKMKPEWFGWQTALSNASTTGIDFEYSLLKVSIEDYLDPLKKLVVKPMWNDMKPLSNHDNINGQPGVKFIDALALSTAAGLGMRGKKRDYIVEDESIDVANRTFGPEIISYLEQCIETYKRGERVHFVIKACKKDEVLPVAKEKCRIFYANPMTLTLLVRKYFLPILRFLQMNPLVSECSVGINCDGPEWEEFYDHVVQHGTDRIFGGDYGKYDQKLPAQLLLAGIRILIDLARECPGYQKEDIYVMEQMAGDLVYAYIAVNGDLIGTQTGTHISGNSLTAVLNGICGSLNLRNAFYSMYPSTVPFRSAVAIMTYGDDNIGSVSEQYPDFNIKSVSEFLAKYGQVYTMPDKSSELRPYLAEHEFEFLKRTNVYNPDIDCKVGVLQESSMFKSLHCYLRPKGCPNSVDEACAINLDTAMRQYFGYGREKYEARRKEFIEIAKRNEIEHMCSDIHVEYDDAVARWNAKYRGVDDVVQNVTQENFVPHSGEEVDLYEKAIKDIGMRCVGRDQLILSSVIGEVDLIFHKTIDCRAHILIVEIKHSDAAVQRTKGRNQLKRIVNGLRLINSNNSYLGVLLTQRGYEVVLPAYENEDWTSVSLPFET